MRKEREDPSPLIRTLPCLIIGRSTSTGSHPQRPKTPPPDRFHLARLGRGDVQGRILYASSGRVALARTGRLAQRLEYVVAAREGGLWGLYI